MIINKLIDYNIRYVILDEKFVLLVENAIYHEDNTVELNNVKDITSFYFLQLSLEQFNNKVKEHTPINKLIIDRTNYKIFEYRPKNR